MNQGTAVAAGSGGSGGGDGSGGDGADKEGAGGGGGGDDAHGDNREAPDPEKYPTCGTKSHPVDVATGRAFTLPIEDLVLPGPLPLSFARTYSTTAANEDTGLGWGWTHSLGWRVEVRRRAVLVWNDRGKFIEFPALEVGATALGAFGWVLRRESWGYAVDVDDGVWRTFADATKHACGDVFLLSVVEDRNKNKITLRRDQGRLVEIVDSAGRTIRIKNTAEGRIASLEVRNASTHGQWIAFATYRYDERGNLVQVTDADGYSWHYEYDEFHRLVKDKDRVGLTFHFKYDAQSRCIESWGDYDGKPDPSLAPDIPTFLADGKTRAKGIHHCKFDYWQNRTTEVSDSRHVGRFFANRAGTLDKSVEGGVVVMTAGYDRNGFQVERTNSAGGSWRWSRDERGRIVETVDPLGRRTRMDWDANGLPVRLVNADGGVTEAGRDPRGNLVWTKDPCGAITRFTHDERGLLTSVTDACGGVTHHAYDDRGNVIQTTTPGGGGWRLAYDAFGRRTAVTDPLGAETRFSYSDRGDLLAMHQPDGGDIRHQYDGEGHLTRVTTAEGRATTFHWGGYHKLCARIDAKGHPFRLLYDREGDVARAINGREEVHSFLRDAVGRLRGEVTFDGRQPTYKTDFEHRMLEMCGASGDKTRWIYDHANQLVGRELPDGSAETFEYDGLGNVVRATNEACDVTLRRDAAGRIVEEIQTVDGREHTVRLRHDPAGRRILRTTSSGLAERMERDAAGNRRRTWLQEEPVAHAVDVLGREVERQLARGGIVSSTFDVMSRVASRSVRNPTLARAEGPGEPHWIGGASLGVTMTRAYAYGADGDMVRRAGGPGATTFGYDPVGQLTSAVAGPDVGQAFRYDEGRALYDGAGKDAREYAPGGRLLRAGGAQFEWDDDGRLIRRHVVSGGVVQTWQYSWNSAGLLGAVERPDGTGVEFGYDAFARRVVKRVFERRSGERILLLTTRFVWDGDVVVHEIDTRHDGAETVRTLVFKDGGFIPLADREVGDGKGGPWRHYVTSPWGAPEALVDAEGNVVEEVSIGVWGNAEGPAPSTTLRFQGQYADRDVELSYNRMRYYDAEAAIYISPDPLGLAASLQAYEYPRDPFTAIDPLGLIPYRRGDYSAGYAAGRATCLTRDGVCQYCQGAPATSCDHIVSVKDADAVVGAGILSKADATAQLNDPQNMLGVCPSCNSKKQDKPLGDQPGCFKPSNPTPRAVAAMERAGRCDS
jgi:RHS repeat-associated protein